MSDLKQRIEDLFVKKRKYTAPEVAAMFKRSGINRVYEALDDLVNEGIITCTEDIDPVALPSYQADAVS